MAEVDREGTGTIEFPEFLSISMPHPPRPGLRPHEEGSPGCWLSNILAAAVQ